MPPRPVSPQGRELPLKYQLAAIECASYVPESITFLGSKVSIDLLACSRWIAQPNLLYRADATSGYQPNDRVVLDGQTSIDRVGRYRMEPLQISALANSSNANLS
jgi:hypothetical protein